MKKIVDLFAVIVSTLKRHPAAIHLLVATLVIGYALVGGFGFVYFEYQRHELMMEKQRESIIDCMDLLMHRNRHIRRRMQAIIIYEACAKDYIPVHHWSYTNCVVFAFTIMATVGFTLSPATTGGQLFFILFALVGIPISMLVLANIGAYIKDATCNFMTWVRRKKAKERKKKFRSMLVSQFGPALVASDKKENEEVEEVEEADMTGGALLVVFVLYMFIGSSLLLILGDDGSRSSFVPSVYKSFVVMTGGDFGQMSGGRLVLVLLKLLYASVGLAIATIAIDVGSDYLKKLHNLGRKLENAANVKVWFGGQQVTVKNLVTAVGKQCNMTEKEMKNFDYHGLVDNAIAEQDGTAVKSGNPPAESPKREVNLRIESEVVPEEPKPSLGLNIEPEEATEPQPKQQQQPEDQHSQQPAVVQQAPDPPPVSKPLQRQRNPRNRQPTVSSRPLRRQAKIVQVPKSEPKPPSPPETRKHKVSISSLSSHGSTRGPAVILHPYIGVVHSKLAIPLRHVTAKNAESVSQKSVRKKRSDKGVHAGMASMAAAMGGSLEKPS